MFVAAVALALSFSAGAHADVGDSTVGGGSVYMADGNKEFNLRSGYYYQSASLGSGAEYTEHGFLLGFGISRFVSDGQMFGLDYRVALSVEPELMVGFTDEDDNTLQHFFAPVFLRLDLPSERMEISAAGGVGLLTYDLADAHDRQNKLPLVGKLSFDYVKKSGVKMGVEAKGHYVLNDTNGLVQDLWGVSGVARISLLF